MGKFRCVAASASSSVAPLPPPPPLRPRPSSAAAAVAAVPTASAIDYDDGETAQPLDYTMVRLQQQELQQQQRQQQTRCSPSSPQLSASSSTISPSSSPSPGPTVAHEHHHRDREQRQEEVLHRLRLTVLQRHPQQQQQQQSMRSLISDLRRPTCLSDILVATSGDLAANFLAPAGSSTAAQQQQQQQQQQKQDPELDAIAVYVAGCIKSRLEGCGKRVHLFLGILLHFGMPPSSTGEQIFSPVIAFSDENKNLSSRPTAYFVVLHSRLLAMVWSKFKGNSSNEYSTLTRAIRSTRQKYKGIFEAVENPGKKLYKFGPLALQQFRQLFPASYD